MRYNVAADSFWATVCKTVRPMLSDRCLCVCPVLSSVSCLSCTVPSVCDVGVLWPNGFTDQDETWHAGRPRPWPHVLGGDPASPPLKGHSPPNFWPISVAAKWVHELNVTWCGGRPRLTRLCVRWGILHYCGQTAGWMKTPLGMEVDIDAGHIVLDRFPALRERAQYPAPLF